MDEVGGRVKLLALCRKDYRPNGHLLSRTRLGDGLDGQADDEVPVFERRGQVKVILMELAVGSQVQAKALLAVKFVVVEALPENPCGRGLPSVSNLQIHRWSVFGSPTLNGALQATIVRTKLDSPLAIHREALISGIAHGPVLPVSDKAPGKGRLGGQVIETFANVRKFANHEVGVVLVNDIVVEILHVDGGDIRRRTMLGVVSPLIAKNPAMKLAAVVLEHAQPPAVIVHQCSPAFGRYKAGPRPRFPPVVRDLGERVQCKGLAACVGHQARELGDRINGWQFLWARAVDGLVRTLVCAAVAHVNDRTFEPRPGFEDTITRDVVERPLHGNAFDVELLSVVPVLDNCRGIIIAVSGLNRIPAQASPRPAGLLVADLKGPRAGVMRHLDLSAQIRAVNNVAGMIFAGDESNCAPQGQVHADTDLAIIQKCELGRRLLGPPAEGAEDAEGKCKA